tara:strand:+ start:6664 stop:7842 length:1179 start_codon:yes stop_codon:yes gene_type:complete
MNKTNLFLVAIAITATLCSESFAETNNCIQIYRGSSRAKLTAEAPQDPVQLQNTKNYFASLIDVDLLQYRGQEIEQVASGKKYSGSRNLIPNAAIDALTAKYGRRRWTDQQIVAELNDQTLKLLEAYRPDDDSDKRFDFLPSKDLGLKVLTSIEEHPVVAQYAANKYQQNGTEIGYCFGRGCYVDLMLMRLGVDRDSIKKIWAVGPMGAGEITWQFHIGHMVRLPDNTWIVIDNVPSYTEVLEARAWGEHFKAENPDGKLRLYITDSDKFTPSLGKYDPVQLGLNINRNRDWYKGYFQDLKTWFENTSDAELAKFLGINVLPTRPTPVNPTPQEIAVSKAEEWAFSQIPPQSLPNTGVQDSNAPHNRGRFSNMWDHIKKFGKRLGFDEDQQQ